MFAADAVPYFPVKVVRDGEKWSLHNPTTGDSVALNEAAYRLVVSCDGCHTLEEITAELSRAYRLDPSQVLAMSTPTLQNLSDEGMIWWRKQRMNWWRLGPPTGVLWDLTKRCNLSCRHCVVDSARSGKGELSLAECQRLIEEMAGFGVRQVILSGGEPTLRRDFLDICNYAAESGLFLQIATNATLITRDSAASLGNLKAAAQVSLDGSHPGLHDAFRGVSGSWRRTVRGIGYLRAAGVPVTLAAVATTANIADIPAIYRLAFDLGVSTFRLLPFVPYGRGSRSRELEVAPEQMRELTEKLREARNVVGLNILPMEFECCFEPPPAEEADSQTHIGCDGAIAYCAVTADGEVLPCNYFSGVQAENIREHDFEWIWHNSQFLNYFRSLVVGDIKGRCQNCSWLASCRGSCIASNFAHGNIFQSNCHCWMAASNHEDFVLQPSLVR